MGSATSRPSLSASITTTPISSTRTSFNSNSNSRSSSPRFSTTSSTPSTPRSSSTNPPLPRLERVFATIHTPQSVREHEQRLRERHLERKRREIVNAIAIERATPSPIQPVRVGFPYYEEVLRGSEMGKGKGKEKKKNRGRGRWRIR